MAKEWQSRVAQGYKTFADPVEDTLPAWIKRRDAESNSSDKIETATQPHSEQVSTFSRACCTLLTSLHDREATAEDFNAFLSTAARHALSEGSLSRLRANFLVDASDSTLQPSQKIQIEEGALRRASELMFMAPMALHLARKIVVVKILEKANLEAFGAAAGKRMYGLERLPEGDPEWLNKTLAEYRAYVAQGKGSLAEKMIENRPYILEAAKAELDEEPYYKLMWHFAGVEILDFDTLHRVFTDYCEKDEAAYGSTSVGDDDEAARIISLREHVPSLDATTLEDVFGELEKGLGKAIRNGVLAQTLVEQGEAQLNDHFLAYGGVEGVLKIKESAFVSQMPKENPHPIGHKENPEHIVLDLARFGMAGEKSTDAISEGAFMRKW